MPLNKSTTYHQSVQFFVHFFSKKIVFLLSKKNIFFKKKILLSFTSNLLSFTTFYSVLPRLVLSFTKYPLFWGHSRSIPQGMILDVQPLLKSVFCPITPSPNGFFDSEASIP